MADRDRIGQIRRETELIQIETDADDAASDHLPVQDVLDQDAADLAVSDIDVVRPLDPRQQAFSEEIFAQCAGDHLGDQEEFPGRDRAAGRELQDKGKSEVPSRLAGPGMIPLAAARRLPDGCHH